MANERSASSGNLSWDGVEVNHQFSKGLRAERLLSAALAEAALRSCALFSVLRPASELAIARAFARMERYHARVHELQRDLPPRPGAARRLVVLRLPEVPLRVPRARAVQRAGSICARSSAATCSTMSDQFDGFALLDGDRRPQAVRVRRRGAGEPGGDSAARRATPRWREHRVVRRLAAEVLPQHPPTTAIPMRVLALSDEHEVPDVAAGGGPCGSRSLKARASASGAPGARSRSFAAPAAATGCAARADRGRGVRRRLARGDLRAALRCAEASAPCVGAPRSSRRSASCDVVVRSPGVSLYRPELRALRARGVPVTTATRCGWPSAAASGVIGVTGTKGKSTTAALAVPPRARGRARRVELAGNIGVPALDLLDARRPTLTVLELSSYQIADLAGGPEVAVVTNLFREHTDWHGSEQRYRADKLRLLRCRACARRC